VQGGGRSTIAVWLVAAVLATIAGMRLLGGGGGEPPAVSIDGAGAGAPGSASAAGSGGSAADRAGGEELYVHVAGAVRRPGLIRVAPDTRVATALERAGGPTRRADLTLVNLAAKLQDGQQVVVPRKGGAPAAGGRGAGDLAAAGLPGAKIHLSTATVDQLDEVDGIGPTLAERIVEYRDAHGGFRSLAGLSEVDGIGEKRLATLRDALQP
jgi:competence protein ComEA